MINDPSGVQPALPFAVVHVTPRVAAGLVAGIIASDEPKIPCTHSDVSGNSTKSPAGRQQRLPPGHFAPGSVTVIVTIDDSQSHSGSLLALGPPQRR
jgi:hypothetical protein